MKITATIVPHKQGTEAWMQHRARSLNASELAAAMGLSSYISRSDLIAQKATGITPVIDGHTQRRFDDGHRCEALARPWAEEIIGEDLYASVFAADVEGLLMSASVDGHTMLQTITWEHKSMNASLLDSLEAGKIPREYHPQMEQGLWLTGAEKCLFMASNGTRDSMRFVWYEPNPVLRSKILPTWVQFQADRAAYVPSEIKERPKAEVTLALPALVIHAKGEITTSNMQEYGTALAARLAEVRAIALVTDQDFSNARESAKLLRENILQAKVAKDAMLAQTVTVGQAARMIDAWCEDMRLTALKLEADVKTQDVAKKAAMVLATRDDYQAHIDALKTAIECPWFSAPTPTWADALKNKSKYTSMQDALNTMLANAKIEADAQAKSIHANIQAINAAGNIALFADQRTLALKAPDDLAAIIEQRLGAEQKRQDEQRESVRLEVESSLAAAQEAKVEAEALKCPPPPSPTLAPPAEVLTPNFAQVTTTVQTDTERARGRINFLPLPHGLTTAADLSDPKLWDVVDAEVVKPADDGKRMNLTEINARLAPLLMSTAGLAELGFEPIEQIKASRLFRASDFPGICAAISAHVLALAVTRKAATV
jgi:putative phage-type endonuclease